jgi:F-type H+-transporting ATPase subunit b
MNLNATLFAQLIVFFLLAWFTMKFVWPPIMNAIDERTRRIAEGLEYSDKTKLEFVNAEKEIKIKFLKANEEVGKRINDSEKRAAQIVEQARKIAEKEKEVILDNARKEANAEIIKLKDNLRKEVASLAVSGAEQIIKKEINRDIHADILKKIEAEI